MSLLERFIFGLRSLPSHGGDSGPPLPRNRQPEARGFAMDNFPLVTDQIDDGKKFVAALVGAGFPVTASAWIKADGDGQWYLYIASPVVDKQGETKAYRRIHPIIFNMPPPFCVEPFGVKLIKTTSRLAKDLVAIREDHPGKYPAWFRGVGLGGLSIEGAYIYPVIDAPPSADAAKRVAVQDKP